jgi:hypothetical protein
MRETWLGFSPNHHISGGKVLKRKSRKLINPLSIALRLAARTLRNSKSALGANFRRLIAKIGMPKAITAMARKLAVLIYRMLKYAPTTSTKACSITSASIKKPSFNTFAAKLLASVCN